MKIYRARARKENGRTEIIPINFRSKEERDSMVREMNGKLKEAPVPGVVGYEAASSKHSYW